MNERAADWNHERAREPDQHDDEDENFEQSHFVAPCHDVFNREMNVIGVPPPPSPVFGHMPPPALATPVVITSAPTAFTHRNADGEHARIFAREVPQLNTPEGSGLTGVHVSPSGDAHWY